MVKVLRKNSGRAAPARARMTLKEVMKLDQEKLRRYAEVVIKRGLFLKEGQPVYIEAQVDNEALICALAEAAYDAGASDVAVAWKSNALDRIRLLRGGDGIGTLSELDCAEIDYHAGRGAAFIRVEKVDLDVFRGVPAASIQKKAIGDRQSRVRYSRKSGGAQTTIICCPTESWAKVVYPDLPADEGVEKLWEAVFTCCRVNEPDPLAAWDSYIANSRRRRRLLEDKQYKTFHYTSRETDLYLSPTEPQTWGGGCCEFPDRPDIFVPNVPTEEIFTCPHKYKAQGYVTSTRPLNFRGQLIDHFRLELKDGKVVSYSADVGEEVLRAILETDEGSCYFGEMALIDKNSPISALHTTFYTTLYDENASCHIALGLAGGPGEMSPEELDAAGINQSVLHVDFMVGSDDMNIQGMTADGVWEDVFIDGSWAPEFTI